MRTAVLKSVMVHVSLLTMLRAHAQNLVPNGGFEDYTTNCGFGLSYGELQDWGYLGCALTPGLAHACNSSLGNGSGVPYGGLGYQWAHGGDAFISVWTLRLNSQGGFPDGNPQKYANVDLVQPLVAGQYYCLRLWMNMADSSSYRTGAFHAFLWYGTPTVCNYQDTAWDTYAAVTFDISGVDTAGWTLLEGGFVANGGESNLTLGAFQTLDEMDTVFLADHSNLLGGDLAIYFIDDVELWACQVGVEEDASQSFNLYPNPATDVVHLALSSRQEQGVVEVFDAQGRLVRSVAVQGTLLDLDVSSLVTGRYEVRYRSSTGFWSRPLSVVR